MTPEPDSLRIRRRTAPSATLDRQGLHPVVARVLGSRGVDTLDDIDYGLGHLLRPVGLGQLDLAIENWRLKALLRLVAIGLPLYPALLGGFAQSLAPEENTVASSDSFRYTSMRSLLLPMWMPPDPEEALW